MEKIVIGLGNPGTKYKFTRHNTGFLLVDEIVKGLGLKWKNSEKFNGSYCISGQTVFLKPQSFMNDSGTPVRKVVDYYAFKPEQIVVIHDDVDLQPLQIKKQIGAGAAGHHGVEDIAEKLGSKEFWRIRVGIGRPATPEMDIMDWVLANYSKLEMDELVKKADELSKLLA